MNFDEARAREVRARLLDSATSPQDAATDLARAADMARQEPSVASIIAERVRADRFQWRQETRDTPRRSIDHDAAARCVAHAACASLAATAMLELEERGGGSPEWAKALISVAGEMGLAHLARMRVRPGWSELFSTVEPTPYALDALVSPIADIRNPALSALVATPRPVHLRALLLTAEFDRELRKVLRLPWNRLEVAKWLPLLGAHARASRLDQRLAQLPHAEFIQAANAMNMTTLLYDLIDAGTGRAPMETQQELSPGLRELEADGAAVFVARHISDPRLTDDERALLEDAEVQLATSAQQWNAAR